MFFWGIVGYRLLEIKEYEMGAQAEQQAEQQVDRLTNEILPMLEERCAKQAAALRVLSAVTAEWPQGARTHTEAGANHEPSASRQRHQKVEGAFMSLKGHSDATRALLNGNTSKAG